MKILYLILIPLFIYSQDISGTILLVRGDLGGLNSGGTMENVASGATGSDADNLVDGGTEATFTLGTGWIFNSTQFYADAITATLGSWSFGTSVFSISIYFKISNNAISQGLLGHGFHTGTGQWLLSIGSDDIPQFGANNGLLIDFATGTISTNTEYLITIVRNAGDDLEIYLDGALVSTTTDYFAGVDLNETTYGFRVGSRHTVSWLMAGTIHEIRLVKGYSMTLTDQQSYLADLQCRYLGVGCAIDEGLDNGLRERQSRKIRLQRIPTRRN